MTDPSPRSAEAIEGALDRLLSGLPTFLGDSLKVAIATALLYFWGTVYLSAYATTLGVPFDMLSIPFAQVVFAPWEAVETFVADALGIFFLLVLVPLFIRALSYIGHALSRSLSGRLWIRKRWTRLRNVGRPASGTPVKSLADDEFDSSLRMALYRAFATMGLLALLIAGIRLADSGGRKYAGQRLAHECRVVTVLLSTGTMPGNRVEFCARFGDDLVFRVDSGATLNVVRSSDIRSVVIRPAQALAGTSK